MFSLDHRVAFYVPSTRDNDKVITADKFRNRTVKIARSMSQLFGGATAINAEGFYVAKNGQLITEAVKLVNSFATAEAVDQHYDRVIDIARQQCRQWKQESIAVEIDGILYLVD